MAGHVHMMELNADLTGFVCDPVNHVRPVVNRAQQGRVGIYRDSQIVQGVEGFFVRFLDLIGMEKLRFDLQPERIDCG